MEKTVYSNGFRISINPIEVQICFNCNSPIINEETNEIIGANSETVADVRMNPVLAHELYVKLKEQFDKSEEVDNAR